MKQMSRNLRKPSSGARSRLPRGATSTAWPFLNRCQPMSRSMSAVPRGMNAFVRWCSYSPIVSCIFFAAAILVIFVLAVQLAATQRQLHHVSVAAQFDDYKQSLQHYSTLNKQLRAGLVGSQSPFTPAKHDVSLAKLSISDSRQSIHTSLDPPRSSQIDTNPRNDKAIEISTPPRVELPVSLERPGSCVTVKVGSLSWSEPGRRYKTAHVSTDYVW